MNPQSQRPNSPLTIPPRSGGSPQDSRTDQDNAAANIVRNQIDTIYEQSTQTHQAAQHTPEPSHQATQKAWHQYHSAWQNYYQQYYERYYMGQVHATQQRLEASHKTAIPTTPTDKTIPRIGKQEATREVKSELRKNIEDKARVVKESRHFWPAMAALTVMCAFLFLQYNRVAFAMFETYVKPTEIDPQVLSIDPNADIGVGPTPRIIVPKVNINVPIEWNAVASDQNSLNRAMDKGAAWFNIPGANARPGEIGNSVYSAHSSNDWLDQGDYKFAFAPLVRVTEGDTIYINYNSKRYVYTVTHTKVVKPTDVGALTDPVDKPTITLITCVPLGTADSRLLVFASQVSPDPAEATKASESNASATTESKAAAMPRSSPTFLERLFGNR